MSATVISGNIEGPSIFQGAFLGQSSEETEKARMVWDLFQKAKSFKMRCGFADAEEHWDFWRGKQWRKIRPPQYSMAVVNELYATCESFVGHISDSIPESVARARSPKHIEAAQVVTKLLSWSNDLNDVSSSVELPTRSAVVTGFGVWRLDWDQSIDGYRGAPSYNFVDEMHLFVSPYARQLEDAEYVIEARNVPLSWVVHQWEDGKLVPPGIWDGSLSPLGTTDKSDSYSGHAAFTTTDGAVTQVTGETGRRGKERSLVTLIEAWIRQEDGTLRYIVVCNGVILQDGPSPYEGEDYPYVLFNVIRSKDHPYGYSMISFIKKLQMELNEMHSYALDQQRYESDSPLVISLANLEEGQRPTNAPGSVYIDADPNRQGYYLLNKPGANPRWLEMQEHVVEKMRSIAGNVTILRGERPVGVSTLGGMEIVRDEANVLVAKMTRHIHSSIRKKDILTIKRIKQFMTEARVISISGERGKQEFISINQPGELLLNGSLESRLTIPENFEANVDLSTSPAGGESAKYARAMELLQAGVVDTQYVLEEIGEDQGRIDELGQRMSGAAQKGSVAPGVPGAIPTGSAPGQVPTAGGVPVSGMPPPEEAIEQDPQEIIRKALAVMTGGVAA